MEDFKAKIEKFLLDAEDCDLIAKLATDNQKRETFQKLAEQCRAMAADLQQKIQGQHK